MSPSLLGPQSNSAQVSKQRQPGVPPGGRRTAAQWHNHAQRCTPAHLIAIHRILTTVLKIRQHPPPADARSKVLTGSHTVGVNVAAPTAAAAVTTPSHQPGTHRQHLTTKSDTGALLYCRPLPHHHPPQQLPRPRHRKVGAATHARGRGPNRLASAGPCRWSRHRAKRCPEFTPSDAESSYSCPFRSPRHFPATGHDECRSQREVGSKRILNRAGSKHTHAPGKTSRRTFNFCSVCAHPPALPRRSALRP